MPVVIDARGLGCPQPVIMAKKAIEENEEITILVDDDTAVENIRRMAGKMASAFSAVKKEGGVWEIALSRTGGDIQGPQAVPEDGISCDTMTGRKTGPLVVALSDNHMGRGDDVLGDILIRSFVHTLLQLKPLPETVICYNAGVKLAVKGSEALDDLQQLERAGVDILVCGTCVNYFGITDQVAVGHVSNMYDIAETMAGAGRLVRP